MFINIYKYKFKFKKIIFHYINYYIDNMYIIYIIFLIKFIIKL